MNRIFLIANSLIYCADCLTPAGVSPDLVEEMKEEEILPFKQSCCKCSRLLVDGTVPLDVFPSDGSWSKQDAERLIKQIREHEQLHEEMARCYPTRRTLYLANNAYDALKEVERGIEIQPNYD